MTEEENKPKPVNDITKIALIVTALALVSAIVYTRFDHAERSPTAVSAPGLPQVQIGGPFSLIDHNGQTVTEKTYAGKFMLLFFGYTYCPDVCPTDLAIISDAMDQLPANVKDQIQPIFISVDTDRDSPAILKEFVPLFHPKLVGLTGSKENIAKTARLYRAYYAKAGDPNAKEDYLVDHSATTYLMAPDGSFLTTFSHAMAPEEMAAGIKKFAELAK